MLAEMVKAGKLPPVDQRLPAEPVVVKPTRKIGKYGGTAYGEGIDPNVTHDMQIVNTTGLFSFNNDISQLYPLVASSWKFSADYKSCTVNLRKGIKWSDGTPFTVDDMLFYFEDMVMDTGYAPVTTNWVQPGKQKMKITKVDDFTIQFDFAVPNPAFYLLQKTSAPIVAWRQKKFYSALHPKYNPNAEAQAKADGFQGWAAKLTKWGGNWNYGEMPAGVPTIDPWAPVKNTPTLQNYDRNPYYFAVDTEGNQLPYIDKWAVELAQTLEIFNTRAMSGNLSIAGLNLLLANYPLLKGSADKSGYSIVMVYSELGADVALAFNQIHQNPVMGDVFRDVRFRQAMSVAINRKAINELVFLGLGSPRQACIHSSASFFKKEWADAYAQYDVALANKLLDQMGLDKKGPDGVRLMKDGKPLAFQLEYVPQEGPKKEVCELVVKDWQAVGVKADAQAREKAFLQTRENAQQHDASGWQVDRTLERAFWCEGWGGSKLGPGGSSIVTYAKEWQNWINSGGKTGVEPPRKPRIWWPSSTSGRPSPSARPSIRRRLSPWATRSPRCSTSSASSAKGRHPLSSATTSRTSSPTMLWRAKPSSTGAPRNGSCCPPMPNSGSSRTRS
jgi:peptide/nickel transport system substrate-binding protein